MRHHPSVQALARFNWSILVGESPRIIEAAQEIRRLR
jgi:hypothetical protein